MISRFTGVVTTCMLVLFGFTVKVYGQGQGSPNVPLLENVNGHAGAGYNDCWGYTAPDGREYALLGVQDGTSIIDITDNPPFSEVTFIPSITSIWRDIKVYENHAFIVADGAGIHGMQVLDLAQLSSVTVSPKTLNSTALYFGPGFNASSGLVLGSFV